MTVSQALLTMQLDLNKAQVSLNCLRCAPVLPLHYAQSLLSLQSSCTCCVHVEYDVQTDGLVAILRTGIHACQLVHRARLGGHISATTGSNDHHAQ